MGASRVGWCGLVELWVGVCGSSVPGSGYVNRGSGQKPSGFWPLPLGVLWRCPTLPQPIGCSTIGAAGLSFQVRNVAGRFPGAVTTTRLGVQHCPPPVLVGGCGLIVVRIVVAAISCSLLFLLHPHVLCGCLLFSVGPLVPVGSRAPRGASTSGLSTRSSGGGLSPHGGAWKPHLGAGFPLRCFQRLSLPNVANQPCTWRYNWHTRGSSIPVLSY